SYDMAVRSASLVLPHHSETLPAKKIDPAVLPTLSDDDLRELGLPLGDRKKLRAAIRALGGSPPAASTALSESLAGALPRAVGEQRHLTVMFCDIVDSTPLAATLDLETLQLLIDTYQQQVADCVARYDGFVAKFMGDGVLAYFGCP